MGIIEILVSIGGIIIVTIMGMHIWSLTKRVQLLEAVAIEMYQLLGSTYKFTEDNARYINHLWMTYTSDDKELEPKVPFTIN
jgi:hypothetical protein